MLASVSVIFIEHAALVLSGFQKTQGPVGYVGSLRSDQCLHYVSRQYLAPYLRDYSFRYTEASLISRSPESR